MTHTLEDTEKKYFVNVLTETSSLLALWYQWEALFDRPRDQLDRIARAGNLLFGSIERVFYRDVALGICRLTDRECQGKNRNISIQHFKSGSYKIDSHLQELVDDALKKADPFKRWRDKRLAHIDATTGIGWRPPQGGNREAVSEALRAICIVLQHISEKHHERDILLNTLKLQITVSVEKTLSNIIDQKNS